MIVCVLNANPGGNKGAEAMLMVLINELSKIQKIEKILIESPIPSNSEIKNRFISIDKKLEYFTYNPRSIKPYSFNVFKIDYFIDISGISFVDSSFRHVLRNFLKYLPLYFVLDKLIFFTQDFGPTNNFLNKFFAGLILKKSKSIFTRSEFSKINLNKISSKINIKGVFPDSTFLLKPHNKTQRYNFDKYVILSPSVIMYNKHGSSYERLFKDLYEFLKAQFNVVFLVHNFTKNGSSSDKEFIRSLQSNCPQSSLICNEKLLANEYKTILGKSEFAITSRYHVLVGSLSQSVPCLAIGWNPKYDSFLKLYNLNNWSVNYDDITYDNIISLIENEIITLKKKNQIKIKNNNIHKKSIKSIESLIDILTYDSH